MINFGKFQLKFCIQMSLIMCVQMQMSETNAMQCKPKVECTDAICLLRRKPLEIAL